MSRNNENPFGCGWKLYWVLMLLLAGFAGFLLFETEVGASIVGVIALVVIVFAVVMFISDVIKGK